MSKTTINFLAKRTELIVDEEFSRIRRIKADKYIKMVPTLYFRAQGINLNNNRNLEIIINDIDPSSLSLFGLYSPGTIFSTQMKIEGVVSDRKKDSNGRVCSITFSSATVNKFDAADLLLEDILE